MSEIVLGEGTYGKVVSSSESDKHAVKNFEKADFKFFIRELWCLSLVKDIPNFCQLISYDIRKIEFTMFKYETTLFDLMNELNYSERVLLTDDIIEQSDKAVSFLHERGIAHNDISLSNIFCNYNRSTNKLDCFLGDFSLTSINDDYKSHDKKEYLYHDRDLDATNMESDVWALGISVFYFLSKIIKWKDIPPLSSLKADFIDYREIYPDQMIQVYTYEVLCKFLKFKGQDRPHLDITCDVDAKFHKLENKNKANKSRKEAIEFMRNVTVERCLVSSPDNRKFVEYFEPLDIMDFVKRNF